MFIQRGSAFPPLLAFCKWDARHFMHTQIFERYTLRVHLYILTVIIQYTVSHSVYDSSLVLQYKCNGLLYEIMY